MSDKHPAAPETETDANGLAQHIYWASDCFEEEGVEWENQYGSPRREAMSQARAVIGSDWLDDYVTQRVRVVEGERDAALAHTQALRNDLYPALDRAEARAESAEAAREAEKAALIALADEWERDNEDHLNRFGQHLMGGAVLSCAEHLRALLGGGEVR